MSEFYDQYTDDEDIYNVEENVINKKNNIFDKMIKINNVINNNKINLNTVLISTENEVIGIDNKNNIINKN